MRELTRWARLARRGTSSARYQFGAIAGQAPTGIALGHGSELAVDALVTRTQGEKGGPLQQRFQRPIRALADQLELEAIGLADGLVAVEGEHLEILGDAVQRQGEEWGIG